jgi:hypothetical protein
MTEPPEEPSAMTDLNDETQPHPNADPGGAANPARDPGLADPAPASGPSGSAGSSGSGSASSERPLRADPDRPADSGWREPPWFPPRDRGRNHRASPFAMVVGLIFIAVGAYYFVDRTLGIALPRIQWSSAWPVILIIIGGLILIRSFQRRA